jgi:hypothetical protein
MFFKLFSGTMSIFSTILRYLFKRENWMLGRQGDLNGVSGSSNPKTEGL